MKLAQKMILVPAGRTPIELSNLTELDKAMSNVINNNFFIYVSPKCPFEVSNVSLDVLHSLTTYIRFGTMIDCRIV